MSDLQKQVIKEEIKSKFIRFNNGLYAFLGKMAGLSNTKIGLEVGRRPDNNIQFYIKEMQQLN